MYKISKGIILEKMYELRSTYFQAWFICVGHLTQFFHVTLTQHLEHKVLSKWWLI